MFRTRLKKEIVTEFLPPRRMGTKLAGKRDKVIVLCDGMPSMPRKQGLAEFLAQKGYWVFYPRYRGAWESGGQFLERSPQEDIRDLVDEIAKGKIREVTFGQRFELAAKEIFVIGGSFGGAAAILASLDPRVKKVIANCPVVDWSILAKSEETETSNPNYAAYIREAFGGAYRLSDRNWKKLSGGKFYNPMFHARAITASKVLMFHAQDDPHVPYESVLRFAERTGVRLKTFRRGGHLSTDGIVRGEWKRIREFFEG